ncbi:helix-turn-helix transcriptional regulator [Diaphorobacter sp. HDW4A]|uniref:XRE family transcriptional regulator n=1 Tax=Diaphorobacter sp. HDW4A TaxID=2714924 RepID=UPI00140D5C40|nr:XRE family transcriptional regulator [Diaphorobacter sp. HDW4A]QIL78484.1 helix-turn-helix transcriptional regulator [Diaphorobacter sp. HDW4A]QIL80800.1 helix-turn-helix transcriptional regulator [Diaphorobacter sp. HDW4A]
MSETSPIRAVIGERLKEERERLNLTVADVAKFGDMPSRTIYGWENGVTSPKVEFFASTQALGFDVHYIVTGSRTKGSLTGPAPAPISSEDTILIPRLNVVASMGPGNDLVSEEIIMGDVPMSLKWIDRYLPSSRPEALRIIHQLGDSMQGTLASGDFGICDTDKITADVDGIYVLEAHERLFIKRVTQRMDGRHEVTSDNPNVRTVDVLNGEHQVRICGRIVYGFNGRRF